MARIAFEPFSIDSVLLPLPIHIPYFPFSIISTGPPQSVVIIGKSAYIASTTVFPNPSLSQVCK